MCFFDSLTSHQCLADVGLIPPCDRVLLEMTFCELNKWTVQSLRQSLLQADRFFKYHHVKPAHQHTGDKKKDVGVSLGCLPVSRFIQATLSMLTGDQQSNSFSALLNSSLVALTQTLLAIAGLSSVTSQSVAHDIL